MDHYPRSHYKLQARLITREEDKGLWNFSRYGAVPVFDTIQRVNLWRRSEPPTCNAANGVRVA